MVLELPKKTGDSPRHGPVQRRARVARLHAHAGRRGLACPAAAPHVCFVTPRVARRLERLRSSLWTLPVLAVAVGAILGAFFPRLDKAGVLHEQLRGLSLLHAEGGSAESMIGSIASALATVLGVLFSITIVALQLASTQYSPRVLRRFIADRATKATLATFLGTVAMMVVAQPAVPQQKEPLVTLAACVLFALICLCLVGWFLHHLARSIDAATIVRNIGEDSLRSLRNLALSPSSAVDEPPGEPAMLRSSATGYLEIADPETLLRFAPKGTRLVRVEVRAGDFVIPGLPLLAMWPPTALDRKTCRKLHGAFAFSRQRTLEQDLLYGVRQLVDVGLKALSPAINDPTTAYMAVNELGLVLRTFIRRDPAVDDGWRRVERDGCTVAIPVLGLRKLMRHAFEEIAHASRSQLRVPARILEVMEQVIEACDPSPEQRAAFTESARWIHASADIDNANPVEQAFFDERYRSLLRRAAGQVMPAEEPALH